MSSGPAAQAAPDAGAILRSRGYLRLLVLSVLLGIPISALAYAYLQLVNHLQAWVFQSLPETLGFHGEPWWWPVPPLLLAGILVAFTIRYLQGGGGHSPLAGFGAGGGPGAGISPAILPGVVLASLATLALGAVLGPEAPLIAIGGGLGAGAVLLIRRGSPPATVAMMSGVGSFAAISTLLGSPILGAFLLMEAVGLGGPMLDVVLVPGLLASGAGALVFIGLDAWTGLGTVSLVLPSVPSLGRPDLAELGWALVIGVAGALLGSGIRWLGLLIRPLVERRLLLLTPLMGVVIAGAAILYGLLTGRGSSEVLFSGQFALGPLIANSARYSASALVLLVACKGLAYSVSLSSFRGGPIFPSLFIGAAGGIGLSHLPGLPAVAGAAMGMGAMCAVMLRLPLTSVMLATLLLLEAGLTVMPLVIVSVAVAYVVGARLAPGLERAALVNRR